MDFQICIIIFILLFWIPCLCLGHCFVLRQNCCSQKVNCQSQKKSLGFSEILDQMNSTEAPNSKKNNRRAQNFFVIESTTKQGCLIAVDSRATYCQKYILLEQSDFSILHSDWSISYQAGCLNTANSSHVPGRTGL